ncbi:SAVED domain-containing protein [Oxalobacteraceae bacterium OTU3CAMAD1]|nr:SAVED domain-containing protein [Oxalobacteraceae bacterium OTU3CAMAD1]
MKNLFYEFCSRAIDWIFRVRTMGALLLKGGLLLLIGIAAVDFAFQVNYRDKESSLNLQFGTGGALPDSIVYIVVGIAALLLISGIYVLWRDDRRERLQLLIVVEVRGLNGTVDTPSVKAVKTKFRGNRHPVVVDFRPSRNGELVNPELMLSKIEGMKLTVDTLSQGRDKSDVFVAVGGIAAVPAMFLVGKMFEDESHTDLYDWDRDLKCWKMIDRPDDGKRVLPLVVPTLSPADTEIVLAVSASYPVDDVSVAAAFPGLSVAQLSVDTPQVNSYWSEVAQQAFAAAFRDSIQQLMGLGIRRIHLVLAGPVSLVVRMGSMYDDRLHPELIVYQYEKSSTPPYPWGVVMPTHGSPRPTIHKLTVPAAGAADVGT